MCEKNRLIGIDVLKLIAIYLVIYGHCVQYLLDGDFHDNMVWITIYTFHMPVFMVISGYFAKDSMDLKLSDLVKKKAKQLIFPMIFWSVLLSILSDFINYIRDDKIYFCRNFVGIIYSNFWFLKCLFICYLFCYITHRLYVNRKVFLGGNFYYSFFD